MSWENIIKSKGKSPFMKEYFRLKELLKQKEDYRSTIRPRSKERQRLEEKYGMPTLEEKMRKLGRNRDDYPEEYESLFLEWKEAYNKFKPEFLAFMKSQLEELK